MHVNAHYAVQGAEAEVHGLACHPEAAIQYFATCGADRRVRIWNDERTLRVSEPFAADITSLDWSPTGQAIIVGDARGNVWCLDQRDLSKASHVTLKVNKRETACCLVKVAPDSRLVACGVPNDSHVQILALDHKALTLSDVGGIAFKDRMTNGIRNLDWSVDSTTLQVLSGDNQLEFASVKDKKRVEPESVRDTEWNTQSCRFGWSVDGIWSGNDWNEINAFARSSNNKLIATCDDNGMVRLFRYPCVQAGAVYTEYRGHSAHVLNAAFSPGDKYLLTVGGQDRTVLVWATNFRVSFDDDEQAASTEEVAEINDELADESKAIKQKWKNERRELEI